LTEGFRSIEKASSLSVATLKEREKKKQIKHCVQSSVQSFRSERKHFKGFNIFFYQLKTEFIKLFSISGIMR
jgi:hypothetical protein